MMSFIYDNHWKQCEVYTRLDTFKQHILDILETSI